MSKEAMKLALGVLSGSWRTEEEKNALREKQIQAVIALREALAKPDFWEGYVPEPVKPAQREPVVVFREIKVGEYVLRFWPSDNGWMCGITSEMMQALAEQPAPVQQEPTVSKGAYNRVRDDYNDLLKQSEQDAKDAKEWRAHVNRCKLAGIDLDYQITAPQPAQQEYASFAEWAHDYVQDNLHKLKEKNT